MSRAKADPVDWASCLRPLDGEPCGHALAHDPAYAAIREARREDDPDLPQGVWERELKQADWNLALSLSLTVLRERSKDLQAAGWACEAALMLHGFPSLPGGLRMIAGLCSFFGDCLHPLPEEGDQEARLARFAWLDETLAQRAALLPLTEPSPEVPQVCTFADWMAMERRESLQNGNGKNGKNGDARPDRRTLNLAGAGTSPGFHAALHEDVRESLLALRELGEAADALCGEQAPCFHALRERLERLDERALAWHPLTESLPAPEDAAKPPSLSSRAQAYATLSTVADYLMRTEPHSPAPWLVKRAVAWGGMPLAELLDELLGQGENLASIKKLLGMTKD